MLAVLKTGSKQYSVKPGDVITIEKLDAQPGDSVEFSQIVILSDDEGNVQVGSPFVDNAKVTGEVVAQVKGQKIIVFKFKKRKKFRRKQGHRQKYTTVRIKDIII